MTGTSLPPQLLLMAKLVVIALIVRRYWMGFPDVFAPMFRWMEVFPEPWFRYALTGAFLVAACGLLSNRAVRVNCVIIGSVFLLATLSSKVYYRNAKLFVGLLMVLTGLQQPGKAPWLIWWQLAVLYFGAGLNKLLEVDWRNGVYFNYYLGELCRSELYWRAKEKLPDMWLPWAMGWSVILMEIGGAVLFLFRGLRPAAVWVVAWVHVGAAILVANDYGVFLAVILASYLSCMAWPDSVRVVSPARGVLGWARYVFRWLDFDRAISWEDPGVDNAGGVRLSALGRHWTGWRAVTLLIVWCSPLYVIAVLLLTELGHWVPNAYVIRGFGYLGAVLLVWGSIDRVVAWLHRGDGYPSGRLTTPE